MLFTLRSWSADKKITTKIEDLQPSEWFKEKFADWQKALQNWQLLQQEFKSDPVMPIVMSLTSGWA